MKDPTRQPIARILAAALRGEWDIDVDTDRATPLVAAACRHKVPGLLLEAFDRLGLEVPAVHREELSRLAARTAAINLAVLHALEPIIGALDRSGVPVMLLKGAALLLETYPGPHLRPMTDVDLLVRPADAARTLEILDDLGCAPGRVLLNPDFFPRYYYEREYFTPPPLSFRLDVHARPLRPLRFAQTVPPEALWSEVRCVERNSVKFTLPSPEAQLVHLAAHSAVHGNPRLLWLYDLMRVPRQGLSFDDALFAQLATDWGLAPAARRGLVAAARLFGDRHLACLAAALGTQRNWRDTLVMWQAPRDRASPLSHMAVDLLTTPGWRYRMGYLRAVLFPGDEHLGQVYPWRHHGWRTCALMWRGARRPLSFAARVMTPHRHAPA